MPKHALFTEGNAGGKHRLVADESYTDLFNRPDNSATVGGSGWSVHNRESSHVAAAWAISGNQAVCTAMPVYGGGANEAMLLHDASSGDFTMTITLGAFVDGANEGASISAFRVGVDDDDGAEAMGFWLLRNDLLIRVRSNEGGSTILSLAETFVAGDIAKIVAVGDNIKVYRNDTKVIELTDSYNMTKTWHGLASYMPSYDHFKFDAVTFDTVALGGQHAFYDGFYTDTEWLPPGSDKHVVSSPTIYRTSPAQTRRIYSDGSSSDYTVIRWYFDAVPGGVYHLGYWMKDGVPQGTTHDTYLEVQQFPSGSQTELQGPVTITTADWTLVDGIYTASPSTTDTQFCMLVQSYRSGSPPPPYFETYIADWFVTRVG